MNIYVSVCDKYIDLLKIFCFLFNRFWSEKQKVTILGYKRPSFTLPSNFDFISLNTKDKVENWSTDLRRFFESIDDKYFIHSLEDYFILEPVRLDILELLKTLCVDNTGRICLNNDLQGRKHTIFKNSNMSNPADPVVVSADQDSDYRISTQMSIWSKDYLLKYLDVGLTPWQFEVNKSRLAKKDGWNILGTKGSYVVEYSIGKRKNSDRLSFDYINSKTRRSIDDSVMREMKESKLI